MKKIISLLLVLLSLSACEKKIDVDTLVVVHRGEMLSLDPVYSYDGVTHGLLINIYDTLLKFNGNSLTDLRPGLSTEVPSVQNGLITEDGLHYVFPIRKGVKFHDGTVLTPEDVRYSLLRFLLSDIAAGPSTLLLEPVLGVTSTRNKNGELVVDLDKAFDAIKVEGDNVIVTLDKPFGPFLSILARWGYIVSKDWAVAHGAWNGEKETLKEFNNFEKEKSPFFKEANGTGPFKLAKWDISAKRVLLQANEEYYTGAPRIKSIHMMTVDEPSTARLMLESGDADIAELSPKFVDQVKDNPNIVLYDNLPRLRTDPTIFFTLSISMDANPDVGSGKLDGEGIPSNFFTDKNLRKAFEYAFDYDNFISESMQNKGERAIGPAPKNLLKYDQHFKKYDYNMEKAKEYFKKAWGGDVWNKGFKFTLTYNTGGEMRQMACEMLKRNVESINPKFQIELRGVPWATFLEKTARHQMPMWSRGWVADYADVHNFYFPFFHSQGTYALAQGYSNPEIDNMLEQAVSEVDSNRRSEDYKTIHNLMYEEALQIYVAHPTGLWAVRKNVKDFIDNPVYMGIYFYPIYKEAQ